MSAYDDTIKNQAAALATARAAEAVPVKGLTTGPEFLQLPFKPGDRVLDRITGQQGVVINGTIQDGILPATNPNPPAGDHGAA
jgi:hypothetical protein